MKMEYTSWNRRCFLKLYKIISVGEGRSFECALQFAVTNESILYGASFVGFPSAAWAVDAALCGQKRVIIEAKKSYELWPGPLRHFERKVGRFNHMILLPKSVVLNDDDTIKIIVVDWSGDIKQAVGKYMAKKFHLPWEWVDDYYDIFRKEELTVISDPEIGGQIPTGAVRLFGGHAGNLTQEDVDETVSQAVQEGRLKIPASVVRGSYAPGVSLQEYLKINAQVFATQVAAVKPLHDPADKETLNPAIAMDRIPYPAQSHAIQGIVKLLKKQDTAILCGDMGTGSVRRSAIRA